MPIDEIVHQVREHSERTIPEFPSDDEFAEWVAALLEVDGYYVGKAMSFTSDDRDLDLDVSHLRLLEDQLLQFSSLADDQECFRLWSDYFGSLRSLVLQLMKVSKNQGTTTGS